LLLRRGLNIPKFAKTPLIYSILYFNLGSLGALFGGAKAHRRPPMATGLALVAACFGENLQKSKNSQEVFGKNF